MAKTVAVFSCGENNSEKYSCGGLIIKRGYNVPCKTYFLSVPSVHIQAISVCLSADAMRARSLI